MGLVNKVVPFDQLEAECVDWVRQMFKHSATTLHCAPVPAHDVRDASARGAHAPSAQLGEDLRGAVVTHIPLVLYKNARDPELCAEFLEFLFEEDVYIDFLDSVPVEEAAQAAEDKLNELFEIVKGQGEDRVAT